MQKMEMKLIQDEWNGGRWQWGDKKHALETLKVIEGYVKAGKIEQKQRY